MLNNFIYAQTKDLFLNALNAGNVLDEAIVFIADTKEIWNHGTYFGGTSDPGIDPEVLSGIETAIATLQSDKADKSELANYAKKNELPSLDGYLTKTVADGLYATIAQYNTLNQTVGNIQTELSNKLTSADLEGYAKTADVPTKISDLTDDSDFITNTEATATYAPKSLVETVSNQATTISTLATKSELSTGLAGKLDNSAASGFVPTTRKVNGVALDKDITITATDPNAATKTELNNLSTNLANNYVTNGTLSTELNKKQGVINDLATIRSGAAAGATALQAADLDEINESISDIETALNNKAESSALSNYATTEALTNGLSGKQATLVSGTNIKTIEGQSILGSGDIQITAAQVGAYTTGEIDTKVAGLNGSISSVSTQATTNKNAIDTLNGTESTTGSVKAIAKSYADAAEADAKSYADGVTTNLNNQIQKHNDDVTAINNKFNNYATTAALTGVSNRVTAIEGLIATDSDAVIDKWDEVVTFLDGIGTDYDLETLLAAKANSATVSALETRVTNLTTNNIAEGNNLYFTNARAVSALSNTLASYVPTSRTINGKNLTSNITLSASDVGAASTSELNTTNTNLANLTSTVNTKVDKVSGKGLSTNDFTTALKNKLDALPTTFAPTNAEANVQADWNVTDSTSDAFIKNKPTIPTIPSLSGGASAYSHNHGASGSFSGNSNTTSDPTYKTTSGDQNTSVASSDHTHAVSGTTSGASAYSHSHGASGSFSGNSNTTSAPADASTTNDKKVSVGSSGHTHSFSGATTSSSGKSHSHSFTPAGSVSSSFSGTAGTTGNNSASTSVATAAHTHSVTGTVASGGASHTHSFTPAGSVSSSFTGSAVTSGGPSSNTTSVATAAHTHSVSGTVASGGASHTHTVNGTTASGGASHTHTYDKLTVSYNAEGGIMFLDYTSTASGSTTASHTHTMNFASAATTASHTHTFSSGSASATADNTTNRVSVPNTSHTHSVTAAGSISSSFSGTAGTTGATTASHTHTFSSGSASATADNTTNRVSVAAHTHTHSFTPAGSVSSSFSGTAGTTGSTGTDHTHTVGATTGGPSATTEVASTAHKHTVTPSGSVSVTVNNGGVDHTHTWSDTSDGPSKTASVASTIHRHTVTPTGSISVTVNNGGVDHTHTISPK